MPPEVSRPSGGFTAGIRLARAYLTRHLPPLAFLRPTTACSSRRLTCPVSYRYHLWDSKNTNDTLSRSHNRSRLPMEASNRSTSPEQPSTPKGSWRASLPFQVQVPNACWQDLHSRRDTTHHIACEQAMKQEGTSTRLKLQSRWPVAQPRELSTCASPQRLRTTDTGTHTDKPEAANQPQVQDHFTCGNDTTARTTTPATS